MNDLEYACEDEQIDNQALTHTIQKIVCTSG